MTQVPEAHVHKEADKLTLKLATLTNRASAVEHNEMKLEVRRFVKEMNWFTSAFTIAGPGEERLYRLGSPTLGGPTAYIVSDGAGVVSAPHEHETWAIIAGIRGREINDFFSLAPSGNNTVILSQTIVIGPGEVVAMDQTAIHATTVDGDGPTFHLHVYGRPLNELSSFAQRSFVSDR